MGKVIEAIYEKGVFRPLEKVDLREGERVKIRVERTKSGDLPEFIDKLSEKFKDVEIDPLEVLLEMRKRPWD
ncbi:antitoxin family protein [Archaeoglobus neptunius]|uniref:antitoxin family protein n=1 Tax=Archaeoglobus neptunius TaxID=2798580 RepID=UPI001927B36A|nr:antitoxin family protein [Archaeoglobus neptunius]